ncbi:hypothetical protein CC2G_000246 [Coprinopsis cinerea AmutBmut pab1-1]|nr:hypothetical protein CC2G_000246 [Coprinopsis cinerea AmutBmut pab1-1]
MDYAWLKALQMGRLDDVRWVLLVYDINCQYCINFKRRIKKYRNTSLRPPAGLIIVNAIGLWHVHGHRPECYARFAPSFVSGAGKKSGEILEPLWVPMNKLAGPTRTMASSHRAEMLDAGASDSNWKKLTGLVSSICKELPKAKEQAEDALERYNAICGAVTKVQVNEWTAELEEAKVRRLTDFKAMDILNSKLDKEGRSRGRFNGQGTIIWRRPRSDELDLVRYRYPGETGRVETVSQAVPPAHNSEAEARNRKTPAGPDKLNRRFFKDAASLFPGVDLTILELLTEGCVVSVAVPAPHEEDVPDSDYDIEENVSSLPADQGDGGSPEDIPIPLPSTVKAWPEVLASVRRKERSMRIAQANTKLESIRDSIGRLSYLYRSLIRGAKTKKSKTRSYGIVKGSRDELRLQVNHYEQARRALERLGTAASVLVKYQPIRPADIRVSTAIADPNARGQSSSQLSWIWGIPSDNPSDRTLYLDELYRVNWMRTRERYLREEEEYQFLLRETAWVPRFFDSKALEWEQRGENVSEPGHIAYACRQADLWRNLAEYAREGFRRVLKSMQAPVTRADVMTCHGSDSDSSQDCSDNSTACTP